MVFTNQFLFYLNSYHEVSMSLGTIGYALNTQVATPNRSFKLEADLSTVSPTIGSIGGGTSITLTGAGFVIDETTVVIDTTYTCTVQSVTYNEIICITSFHSDEITNAAVQVKLQLVIISNVIIIMLI